MFLPLRALHLGTFIHLTKGLELVGTLGNGRRVYSNLQVLRVEVDKIEFVGGAMALPHALKRGTVPGKIVAIRLKGLHWDIQHVEF